MTGYQKTATVTLSVFVVKPTRWGIKMELNNLLRPDEVAKQDQVNINRIEDQLFNVYQVNLLHQIYDEHETEELCLPLDYEGLAHSMWVYEDELQELIYRATKYDPDKPAIIATKLKQLLTRAGWQFIKCYVEDGELLMVVDRGMNNG